MDLSERGLRKRLKIKKGSTRDETSSPFYLDFCWFLSTERHCFLLKIRVKYR